MQPGTVRAQANISALQIVGRPMEWKRKGMDLIQTSSIPYLIYHV